MNRQAVIFATLAPAVGLGLLLLSKRQQVTQFAAETMKALPEAERGKLAEKIEDTRMRIEETGEALERAIEQARMRAGGRLESFWDNAKKASVSAVMTTLGLSLLSALVIVIYAPERYQQERLWQATKSVLAPVGGTLVMLARLGGHRR